MNIFKNNPNINESLYEKVTINERDYYIICFFESKNIKREIFQVKWNLIKTLTYTDDISTTGVMGDMILYNESNQFIELLSNPDLCYFGLIIRDDENKIIENIYFRMLNAKLIENGPDNTGGIYFISLSEVFLAEGDRRLALKSIKNCTTFSDLFNHTIDGLSTEIDKDITSFTSSEDFIRNMVYGKNFLSLDESISKLDSDEYSICFNAIMNNLSNLDTLSTMLMTCSNNIYNSSTKSFGILKNESKSNDLLEGNRSLTFKDILPKFEQAFNKDEQFVFEILTTDMNIEDNIIANYISKIPIINLEYIPYNNEINKRSWCNWYLNDDVSVDMSAYIIKIRNTVEVFNKLYLKNLYISNILKNDYIADMAKKSFLFNDPSTLPLIEIKQLKELILLNNSYKLSIPGQIFRKSGELIYLNSNEKRYDFNQLQMFNESAIYFVTRVTHSFAGGTYNNNLYINTFTY